MPRTASKNRAGTIADAALQAFSQSGYRRTQVADIAKLAGISPGTIYLYSAGKEALFLIAMQRALGEPIDGNLATQAELLDAVRARFTPVNLGNQLRLALADGSELPTLEAVVDELWRGVAYLGPAIQLIQKCAEDWPELAQLFFGEIRQELVQTLADYLVRGAELGFIRPLPNPELAGRLMIETVAWFAMHRFGDMQGRFYDPLAAEATVRDALVHAYGLPIPQGATP